MPAATLGVTLSIGASVAMAQLPPDAVPAELQGVGVTERLDETIPLDLEFTNQNGEAVRLGDYFQQGKPVILTPIFYECPMLCSLVLNGLVDGLNDVEWSAGDEFEIVTFSFNPDEETKIAEVKRRAYLSTYKREAAKQGWPFLTGSPASIKALTDAIGFHYRYDAKQDTYAHSASIMFLTPDGRLSRYMNDVMFDPRDLRLALVEAGQGRIGTATDKFLLFTCFSYDPDSNSYTADAWKIMRTGGVLTILGLATGLIWLFKRGPQIKPTEPTIILGGMQS